MNNIKLVSALVRANLADNEAIIRQLTDEQFSKALPILSGASIGNHLRHVIEFYICLFDQKDGGVICYDDRKRNTRIETEPEYAISCIATIISNINTLKNDHCIKVRADYLSDHTDFVQVESSLTRELMYNLEHSIHHQALIKIGLNTFPNITIDENYGIAPSTILYKKNIQKKECKTAETNV